MAKTLITGGIRSGKSSFAEHLMADHTTCYITTGYPADPVADPEWAERVYRHQAQRPSTWTTVETLDVAQALRNSNTPALVECLGTWVTRVIDELDGWNHPRAEWEHTFNARVDDLANAIAEHASDVALVTNEVGLGLVSEHASGRLFADLLGRTNQRIAAVCDDVVLVVAGRTLTLTR